MRARRSFVLRLLLAGVIVLAAERGLSARSAATEAASAPIHVTSSQVDGARRGFRAAAGRDPDSAELARLIDVEVDDEILYREALARGLDRDDPVVQRRLTGNMAFVEADAGTPSKGTEALYGDAITLGMDRNDIVVRRRLIARMSALLEERALAVEPTDAELQAALEDHPDRFSSPARVRIAYVRAVDARVGAEDTELSAGATALSLQTERDLARLFGDRFASEVVALPPGRWSGPIAATQGPLLVRVDEQQAARPATLAAVRNQVRALLLRERMRAAVQAQLAELRRHYDVVVDDAAEKVG